MDWARKAIIASLLVTTAVSWVASINQPDMMAAMTTFNPLLISLFTASWTAGMAAMMFPAITPMVLLYSRFLSSRREGGQSSVAIQTEPAMDHYLRSARVAIFIGCYLLVWALTGVALLIAWSAVMNNTIMTMGDSGIIRSIYGGLLVAAGAYQFTPLKRKCIGYCESPMSFFARRWRDGTLGSVKMGIWHGLYCLGCCWPYFLLMVALGWMNLLWMGLFAGIIFGEKIWSRGVWIAKAAGIGLSIVGVLAVIGLVPSLLPSNPAMPIQDNNGGMGMMHSNAGQNITEASHKMETQKPAGTANVSKAGNTIPQSVPTMNMTMH
jgi:predicted metal-binding membrane protein